MSEVKGGRRQLSAAQTRAAILESARELFVGRGFDATAISDIGAAARASKGTVYHHFTDKQEIFAEVFTTVQSAVIGPAIEAMAGAGTAWERLERGTRAFLRGYADDPSARAILRQAQGVLGWDRVRELDEATAIPLIRAGLAQFIADGEIHPVRVDAAAELIFSVYCNAVLIVAAADDPDQAATDVETIVLSLLGGLRTP
ncbi:TetR/AcrR family transcriptional regulator [Spirillospora sp. CA-294931]|uniref:TetR/AcrR family transcriptional regulator n=1 Tax=Spirillospora sp. CA-294931 TaxID=3240042 RepID=UPI003D8E7CAA